MPFISGLESANEYKLLCIDEHHAICPNCVLKNKLYVHPSLVVDVNDKGYHKT